MNTYRTVTVSAPGKLMLLGDHAVVYGRPCIVTAVNQRLRITISISRDSTFKLQAKDVDINNYEKSLFQIGKGEIPKGARFVEMAVKKFIEKYPVDFGISIVTTSDFSSTFGFGSSSASTVCVLMGLAQLAKVSLDRKSLFDLAYKTVLDIQGVGSGFDIAAAIYGGTLYFVGGGKKIEVLSVPSIPIIVGYSGIKADTAYLVKKVACRVKQASSQFSALFDQSDLCVNKGKLAWESSNLQQFADAMNINERLLAQYGEDVETKQLANLINAAKDAGALGAKLSGAGGGDCIIAIASRQNLNKVKNAIRRAGGYIIEVGTGAPGVMVE